MSPLSDWQTCLPVPKRGRARALQIKIRPIQRGSHKLTGEIPRQEEHSHLASFDHFSCRLHLLINKGLPTLFSDLYCQLSEFQW